MCNLREYRQIGRLDATDTFNLNGDIKSPTLRYVYLNLGIDFNIGENCFAGCRGLEIVETAENIISVGESAFSKCESLTSIDLSHCTRVDLEAFYYCVKLARIELLRCEYIGNHAFFECNSLHDLCLRMCSIGFGAFSGSFIQGAKLGLQRCSIHRDSFSHTHIGTLYIENSTVSNIGTFQACRHLTSVVWRNTAPEYATLHITSLCFAGCLALQKVVIQAEVITLEPECFKVCSALQTLMIHATKECSVESDSFIGCESLMHLHFAQQPRLQQGALTGTPRELQLQYALLGYTL